MSEEKRKQKYACRLSKNKYFLSEFECVRKMTLPAIYCLLLRTRVHGRDEIAR